MGAIGGPCSGHLSLSQIALMEASAVGQLKSLPWISQTRPASPGWNVSDCDVEMTWSRANDHEALTRCFIFVVETIH